MMRMLLLCCVICVYLDWIEQEMCEDQSTIIMSLIPSSTLSARLEISVMMHVSPSGALRAGPISRTNRVSNSMQQGRCFKESYMHTIITVTIAGRGRAWEMLHSVELLLPPAVNQSTPCGMGAGAMRRIEG